MDQSDICLLPLHPKQGDVHRGDCGSLPGGRWIVASFGFKPVDEHIERKLMSQLNLIYDTGARKITQAYHQMMNKREHCRLMELVKIDKSARIIQNYLTRYLLRVRFYYKWRARVQFDR
jgi:thioredoxin-related protein